jgi:hypothetical protein
MKKKMIIGVSAVCISVLSIFGVKAMTHKHRTVGYSYTDTHGTCHEVSDCTITNTGVPCATNVAHYYTEPGCEGEIIPELYLEP